ncbi:MAG: DUF86 domain-containing protein [Clostridiales bacterium]|nr:DUF86 domain-containing protein [Clostridiales bacterium]
MTPKPISKRVVADRLETINFLLEEIRSLPLGARDAFFTDRRNIWAAESCLRRSLEAVFDLGRHILAKGFGLGVSEYKEIAIRLHDQGVLSGRETRVLEVLAGYRNRLVHFYHEVSQDELYDICANKLSDVEMISGALKSWLKAHPEKLDSSL